MRDRTLHAILEAFAADAAAALATETANGAEVPFEVVESETRRGPVPLYCYRPLTGDFILDRMAGLSGLPTYSPAVRALAGADRIDAYLETRGLIAPTEPRERADAVLLAFLRRLFDERTDFGFDPARFERAYQELELALFGGRHVSTLVAPVLGLAFEETTPEVALGGGLSLVRGDKLPDGPPQAVWSETGEPQVLIVLSAADEQPIVGVARSRFRRVLTALRLFERGGFAIAPEGWLRIDSGCWRPVALHSTGHPRMLTLIPARQEDELRAFCNVVAKRAPASGEVAWALARFEMGCERAAPFEALTDYLLGLRALLEPEGPASGRLPQRLAALCAEPADRAELAERAAAAVALERAVVAGLTHAEGRVGADGLVEELAEHLRAVLRDVVCGHLDQGLVRVADELLAAAEQDATAAAVSDHVEAPA